MRKVSRDQPKIKIFKTQEHTVHDNKFDGIQFDRCVVTSNTQTELICFDDKSVYGKLVRKFLQTDGKTMKENYCQIRKQMQSFNRSFVATFCLSFGLNTFITIISFFIAF